MEAVCSVCNSIRNSTSPSTSFQSLLQTIRKTFRSNKFQLRILTRRKSFLLQDEYYVNAYYDPIDDENNEIPIEIIIFHNFNYCIDWDRNQVTQFLIQIFDAMVHELKHRRQSRKRNYQIFWQRYTYLEDPDELDAYAISIAIELCRNLGKTRALRYLSKITTLSKLRLQSNLVSPNLYAYLKEYTSNDLIIKTLAKKVYTRIQKIDVDSIFM